MKNLYSYYTQIIFLSSIIINHLFEFYLARRQALCLQNNITNIPDEFQDTIELSDHEKSIEYATTKLNMHQAKLVWNCAVFFYWFPFRGAEKLYLVSPFSGISKEVSFLVLFLLAQVLLSLPWSIYSTFIIEEKFGFNRSTPLLFLTDRLKGLLIGFFLGTPILFGIIYLFNKSGNFWWFYSFIALTLFQFILVWLYPTIIAPLFNKFTPLENDALRNDIEKLVQETGLKSRGVFVMDASRRSSHGNAYFTGFGKNKRVVFFDTLLKDLNHQEILAILAHELGHLKLKHIPKSLVSSLVISFLGFWLMGIVSSENWFYSGHFVRIISPGVLILLFSQAIPMYTFWGTPFQSWISRKREFEADNYAARRTNALDLISGLLKLYKQNSSPVISDKHYSQFYYSHPPALERVKNLKSVIK